MDDLKREKSKGLSCWYLKDVLLKRIMIGKKYHTPGIFSCCGHFLFFGSFSGWLGLKLNKVSAH